MQTVGSLLRTAVHPLDLRYRPVPGGRQVAYVANDIIISKANEIFGFNGWRCEIKGLHTDFVRNPVYSYNIEPKLFFGVSILFD